MKHSYLKFHVLSCYKDLAAFLCCFELSYPGTLPSNGCHDHIYLIKPINSFSSLDEEKYGIFISSEICEWTQFPKTWNTTRIKYKPRRRLKV